MYYYSYGSSQTYSNVFCQNSGKLFYGIAVTDGQIRDEE